MFILTMTFLAWVLDSRGANEFMTRPRPWTIKDSRVYEEIFWKSSAPSEAGESYPQVERVGSSSSSSRWLPGRPRWPTYRWGEGNSSGLAPVKSAEKQRTATLFASASGQNNQKVIKRSWSV